ncbi:unannotated protein [freshwater metagenome]|uniref:Unannotated protein n=1 Tax=freshwater metagenome TaxID=449393 RepID=A0A6J7LFK5_9ZZZZ
MRLPRIVDSHTSAMFCSPPEKAGWVEPALLTRTSIEGSASLAHDANASTARTSAASTDIA